MLSLPNLTEITKGRQKVKQHVQANDSQKAPKVLVAVAEREEVVSDLEDVNGNIALRSVDKLQHGDHQDSASYKELYNECFVSAFAEDLDTLREAGANGKLVLNTIVATSKAFLPSDWQALRRM